MSIFVMLGSIGDGRLGKIEAVAFTSLTLSGEIAFTTGQIDQGIHISDDLVDLISEEGVVAFFQEGDPSGDHFLVVTGVGVVQQQVDITAFGHIKTMVVFTTEDPVIQDQWSAAFRAYVFHRCIITQFPIFERYL